MESEAAERTRVANRIKKPVFPLFSLSAYFICACQAEVQAVVGHSQIWQVIAILWAGVVVERLLRFWGRQRKFLRQSRANGESQP